MDNPHNEKVKRNEEVRELDRQGVSRAKIARQFNLSRQRVLKICGPKYLPGKEGEGKIPSDKIDSLKLALAKYEVTIQDIAKQYDAKEPTVRNALYGYTLLRKELGIGRCSHCKGIFQKDELYGSVCSPCNAKRTLQYYRDNRIPKENAKPCEECGMLVSQTFIGKLNHQRWHDRQDES